ncbi:hypothetical protein CDD80_1457 [Ophiocordyceps camponoti-rufipedis]|uniref:Uncharacterized protein n=1 Tax=Ophiocordyceps camponoti-rufipedis TaxID=2004952 RepID=A0A2C5XYJ8_9HYPO|nr:hypothetical protein CDD80_1457 [Ophiocordyceps camponoti-rufipedis]
MREEQKTVPKFRRFVKHVMEKLKYAPIERGERYRCIASTAEEWSALQENFSTNQEKIMSILPADLRNDPKINEFPDLFNKLTSRQQQRLRRPQGVEDDDDWDSITVFPGPSTRALRLRAQDKILVVVAFIYALTRLVVIVISFTSLRRMPTGVYMDTWTRFVGHFG